MGSKIEINDTLKLKRGAGFPPTIEEGNTYTFSIAERRLYHLSPVRVFLVEDIDGLWNFIGQAQIESLTIDALTDRTSGVFRVTRLYPREYAEQMNQLDAPPGKGY